MQFQGQCPPAPCGALRQSTENALEHARGSGAKTRFFRACAQGIYLVESPRSSAIGFGRWVAISPLGGKYTGPDICTNCLFFHSLFQETIDKSLLLCIMKASRSGFFDIFLLRCIQLLLGAFLFTTTWKSYTQTAGCGSSCFGQVGPDTRWFLELFRVSQRYPN